MMNWLVIWLAIAGTSASIDETQLYGLSPPVYPSPMGAGGPDGWSEAYAQARQMMAGLSLEEKANLTFGYPAGERNSHCSGQTGGIPRIGFQPLCLNDGPAGVRASDFTSGFPAGITIATTWDKGLMYQRGYAIGEEFVAKGVNVALGPVAAPLGRFPLDGRNWEAYSPDPYLTGVGFTDTIRGMQDAGTMACGKHFLLYEQETARTTMTSWADDQTVHELYMWPFQDAVRAGLSSLMSSYNRANYSYTSQNSKLLNGLLKGELNFQGFVVSDWGAQHSGVASANAGLDMGMPSGEFWQGNLTRAVRNGSVSADRLDDMATRILASWYRSGQNKRYPEPEPNFGPDAKQKVIKVQDSHEQNIRDVAAAGTVLLKNVDQALPLTNSNWISVFGYDATVQNAYGDVAAFGQPAYPPPGLQPFNGTLTVGGGGDNTPSLIYSPFQALTERARKEKNMLTWDFWNQNPFISPEIDTCIVFVNSWGAEGSDRVSMNNTNDDTLIQNVAANCSNTIVVVHTVGAILVESWIDHPNVTAVLFAQLPGQYIGLSLSDILFGGLNPSGKLPFTVAKKMEDYGPTVQKPANDSSGIEGINLSNFTEGVYIDYRYFDKHNITPRFEFGYGLSYTTFAYGNISVSQRSANTQVWPPPAKLAPGGNPTLFDVLFSARVSITNSGSVAGKEVAQLYLGIPNSPAKQLRGFETVSLEPGETATVDFDLTRRDLSIWDTEAQQWRLQRADYPIWIGSSSRDLRVQSSAHI